MPRSFRGKLLIQPQTDQLCVIYLVPGLQNRNITGRILGYAFFIEEALVVLLQLSKASRRFLKDRQARLAFGAETGGRKIAILQTLRTETLTVATFSNG